MKAVQTTSRADKQRTELQAAFSQIINEGLTGTERMKVAIQLGVHVRTVERYLNGEVKKIAFGERLLAEIKKFIASNKTASAA